jgi:hypothetical protein
MIFIVNIVLGVVHYDELRLLELLEALCEGVEDPGIRTIDELDCHFRFSSTVME